MAIGASSPPPDAQPLRVRASGTSMFPFVPAGSELTVVPYAGQTLAPGDIVLYPGQRAHAEGLTAHRVIAVQAGPPTQLQVRGDAQPAEELLPAAAVAYVVTRVAHSGIDYRLDGALGRAAARIALRRGLPLAIATLAGRLAVRTVQALR